MRCYLSEVSVFPDNIWAVSFCLGVGRDPFSDHGLPPCLQPVQTWGHDLHSCG